jgi:hypothetical protein
MPEHPPQSNGGWHVRTSSSLLASASSAQPADGMSIVAPKVQDAESIMTSAAGGLLDAFTYIGYIGRGRVFANA